MRKCSLALALLASSLLLSGEASAVVRLVGVRTWSGPGQTRIVFDLSGPVSPHAFRMHAPGRLVVDLPDAKLAVALPAAGQSDLFGKLRTSEWSHQDLRLVISLVPGGKGHVFVLKPYPPYGYRLVIDLRGPGVPPVARATQPPPRTRTQDLMIAIDPGHGGDDPGAIGWHHIEEKNVVLAIARRVVAILNRTAGIHAFLTRKGDYYVPLRRRYEIATARGADAFVSIHADSLPGRDGRYARGSSIYVLSTRGASREARYLEHSENASDLIGGTSLAATRSNTLLNRVLVDMSQTGTISASDQLARDVLTSIRRFGPVHTQHVDHAAFMVLSSPEIPSILIETEFISNPYEARRLANPRFQQALARQIAAGIVADAPALRARRRPVSVPPVRTVEHVVRPGETLDQIAARYHIAVSALRDANGLAGNTLDVGRRLVIPVHRTPS